MFRLLRVEEAGNARMRCEIEEGLGLLSGPAAVGAILCIRPENIFIGPRPPSRDNCFRGSVTDAVHLAGSTRYRIPVKPDCSVVVRSASDRRTAPLTIDDEVYVGWDAEDMLVLSN
jgi:ABC-type Fe3+/spermidine/putrescine transport system ATPase subunit